MTKKPAPLRSGDLIGIVSPASGIAAYCPRRMERGVTCLQQMGFDVVVGASAQKVTGYTAGSIEERIEDLHTMFENPRVKGIVCTIGGYNSNQLLAYLDYRLIERNPKIFLGYSDITALQLAITTKTSLVTFLGPALLPQFGEFGGMMDYTAREFRRVLMGENPLQPITQSEAWTEEHLAWDEEDDRLRTVGPNDGWKALRCGEARGKIVAANLNTLLLLAGTPYFPQFENVILCIEEDELSAPAVVDRQLFQLRHMGVFDQISGLLLGRFPSRVGFSSSLLEELVLRVTAGYTFPIAYDIDFGHTDPMLTLPNGILACLVVDEMVQFQLLEAPTLAVPSGNSPIDDTGWKE